MQDFQWVDEHRESPEEVEAALARVRRDGEHKRRVRKAAAGSSALAVLLLSAIIASTTLLDSNSQGGGPQIAAPTTATPAPSAPPATEVEMSLAAKVINQATTLIESATSIKGMIEYKNTEASGKVLQHVKETVAYEASGNYRTLTMPQEGSPDDTQLEYVYTAATGETLFIQNGQGTTYHQPPSNPVSRFFGVASSLEGFKDMKEVSISSMSTSSGDVWVLDIHNVDAAEWEPVDYHVIINKQSAMMTSELLTYRDKSTLQVNASELVFNARLTKAELSTDMSRVTMKDNEGDSDLYKRTELAKVKALAGYSPIVPSVVPEGYALDSVWYADRTVDMITQSKVVNLTYRKGLSVVTVATSRVDGSRAIDPLLGDDRAVKREQVTVGKGAFKDRSATVMYSADFEPHAFVAGTFTLATVSGPLSHDDFVAILNSLQ